MSTYLAVSSRQELKYCDHDDDDDDDVTSIVIVGVGIAMMIVMWIAHKCSKEDRQIR